MILHMRAFARQIVENLKKHIWNYSPILRLKRHKPLKKRLQTQIICLMVSEKLRKTLLLESKLNSLNSIQK
jgi:hypothetical protein